MRLVAVGLLAASSTLLANELEPSVPPAPSPYRNAPANVRPYLEQARIADFMADPLQRCLAWPEIPGARWPEGLVEAHCNDSFGPRLTLAGLEKHLREGTLDELEAMLKRDLERHYSDDDFSEIIHAHFRDFDERELAGQLTLAWVEAAPESPFAHTARGYWNRGMMGKARGNRLARDTPQESFDRMHAYGDAAIRDFERALELEPRLTEAHAGIISVARFGGRGEARLAAVRQARDLAPACRAWGRQFMITLEPRWGGSLDEMVQFAETLEPHFAKRPLASIVAVMPQLTVSDELRRAERWSDAARVAREATLQTTDITAYRDAGQSILAQAQGNRWEALMYLLGESRLDEGSAYAARQRGRLIWDLTEDVEWAALALQRAVDMDPQNGLGQWLLGGIRATQGRFDDAEAAYREAMLDPAQRRSAMTNLVSMRLMQDDLASAKPYVDALTTEYPVYGWGWFFNALLVIDGKGADFDPDDPDVLAALEKFEQTADPNDPKQLMQLRALRDAHQQALEAMQQAEAESARTDGGE